MNQEKVIICTDSISPNQDFQKHWQSKGYFVEHIPVLVAEKISATSCASADNVLITSANALEFLIENFSKNTCIYTISKNIAEKIYNAGYEKVFFQINGKNSSSLKETFLKHNPKGNVIYLCGERTRTNTNFENINIIPCHVYRMQEIENSAEKILKIFETNLLSLVYISSEQASEILHGKIPSQERIIFKSDYLKKYWSEL